MPTPPQIIVSNSYVGNNPDIPVKVTNPNSEVLPGNVQHVNVDSITNTISTPIYNIPLAFNGTAEDYLPLTTRDGGIGEKALLVYVYGGQVDLASGAKVSTKNSLGANNPTSATVGVTSATILNNNTSRKGLVLTNISTNTISIGIGTAALLYKGISLTPGGTWTMGEYTFYTGSIQAIASAASSELAIQEFV